MESPSLTRGRARIDPPPRWLAHCAGGVPLAYYIAGASAYGGLYEEGTFVAAARSLGVPHPPGAPITSLVSAFAALLPVGPLSFRVAAASAVCAALTLAMFARALFFTLLGVGVRQRRPAALVSLAATWFVAQTPMFFAQATRPNVFAMQFALSMVVIEALTRFELSQPTDDRRTLYFAAFVQGLSFANHYVLGLLMLSVAAPTLGRVFARRGFLGLMGHVAAPILGFSAWVYVPIRGARLPFIDIGEPSRLVRTLWVLSADPWWGPSELPAAPALGRLSEGLGGAQPALALAWYALAALGFVLGARAPSQRRFAMLWLIALFVPLASVAFALEPKLTNDAWGTLMPCALAVVALGACALGIVLQRAGKRFERAGSSAALALCAAALLGLMIAAPARSLARFDAPDLLDDFGRRSLPTRAVLVTHDMGTWFRQLGAEAEEQLRADLLLVPLAAADYPRTFAALRDAAPELGPLLDAYTQNRALELAPLRILSAARPARLELDATVPPGLYPWLENDGLYERARESTHLSAAQEAQRSTREEARYARLHALLGRQARQPELAERLARIHFFQGLLAGAHGERALALAHVRRGLSCAPRDARLLRLQAALYTAQPLSVAALLRPPDAREKRD